MTTYPTPAVIELRVSEPASPGEPITRAADAIKVVARRLAELDREAFVVIHLDAKNKPIAIETISIGCLTWSVVHPREVFKGAIINGAASIIAAHNHPTGDTTPSHPDREVLRRLKQAGTLLGIPLTDFVIVGATADQPHYSAIDSREMHA